MAEAAGIEALIRRDRLLVLSALLALTALSWIYLIDMAGGMAGMDSNALRAASMGQTAWSAGDAALMFVMWSVMMVGMMLPSAAPMVLLYALVARRQAGRGVIFAPTGAFTAGYLIAWTGVGAIATALQWGLQTSGLVTPMMAAAAPWFAGAILIAAGIYQLTPLKSACLAHCRNPMEFLSRSWRKGIGGAVAMGGHHGLYCIGCCWVLMLLLFAGGVMNLLLVACIAAFILVEKLAPAGLRVARITGSLAVAAGLGLIALS